MKAMRIPAAVLILLLLAALTDGFLLTKQCADWTAYAEKMEQSAIAGNWEQAQAELAGLSESWSDWQTWLHILIDHDEIDRAEELMALCRLYIEEKDTAALRTTVSGLRSLFSLLAETEQLNIKNVL